MHCLNPTYDTAVILPPYNTVWAQVLKRGNPPQVVTSGVTVSYRILNNTTSQKTLAGTFDFRQFWTNAVKLFKTTLALDKGLNLDDPGVSNGLSGIMLAKGDHFQVSGIPVVPYDDGSSVRNPYQVAEITVKDASGAVVAQTRATVPTSEEINCGKCHARCDRHGCLSMMFLINMIQNTRSRSAGSQTGSLCLLPWQPCTWARRDRALPGNISHRPFMGSHAARR